MDKLFKDVAQVIKVSNYWDIEKYLENTPYKLEKVNDGTLTLGLATHTKDGYPTVIHYWKKVDLESLNQLLKPFGTIIEYVKNNKKVRVFELGEIIENNQVKSVYKDRGDYITVSLFDEDYFYLNKNLLGKTFDYIPYGNRINIDFYYISSKLEGIVYEIIENELSE